MAIVTDPHLALHFPTSALITIDVQRDFLSDAPYGIPGTTEVLPEVVAAVEAFRAAGRPVVHVIRLYEKGGGNADRVRRGLLSTGVELATPGSHGSRLAPGMLPEPAADLDHELLLGGGVQQVGPAEFIVYKPRWGAFYETPLQDLLTARGVDSLVFVGCNLPNCPRASLIEASERDFRVALVPSAVSRTSEQGLAEVAGLGVLLLSLDEIRAGLAAA
ncbi:cysteine hydrolase [Dactylosporangium fulvum]|uniref:Cysteine hydrolase n=1 Tax=Dactylosporangium fulvum TaxID=53359 RepID=A0ABY5WE15_9ACTN|nr:isochorismatase family cysteine hydrolase [Dactylosporangium fulvum]UWP86966.1 cysteine hydrolase [Dactylosporangium fulvum]